MLIIGENISVTRSKVSQAIKERDIQPILEMAKAQIDAGAHYIDINIGPATKNGPDIMKWIVTSLQDVVDIPLALDTKNAAAVRAGLEVHRGKAIINSTTGDEDQLNTLMPLAKEFNAAIIGLAMAKSGVSRDASERCEVAYNIITAAQQYGVPMEDLYLDPIVLPVAVAQEHTVETLEALKMFKELTDPAPRTVVGLSNLSQSSPPQLRSIINSTYLVMLMTLGLDAAIANPLETELMNIVKTVQILQNKVLYAHSYVD